MVVREAKAQVFVSTLTFGSTNVVVDVDVGPKVAKSDAKVFKPEGCL